MNAGNEWVRTKWKTWVKHKWWINYYNVVSDLKEVGSKSSAVISQYVIIHSCIKVITKQNKVQKGPWNKSELTNQICREQLDVLILHRWSYTGNHSYSGSERFWGSMQTSSTFSTNTLTPRPKKSSLSHSVFIFLKSWPQWRSDVMDLWETQTRREHVESLWAGTPTQNLELRPIRSKSIFIFSQWKLNKKENKIN